MYRATNSSRASMTCARTAPAASARSRTSVARAPARDRASPRRLPRRGAPPARGSRPRCPARRNRRGQSVVDFLISFRSWLPSALQPSGQPLAQRLARRPAPADHQDGVVAGDRADDFRKPAAIDLPRQRLRLSRRPSSGRAAARPARARAGSPPRPVSTAPSASSPAAAVAPHPRACKPRRPPA